MPAEPEFRYKQCLLIRADLKISCGKRCAQLAHAAVGAYEHASKDERRAWFAEGQKKVVLKVPSLQALYELKVIAERQGISTALILGHLAAVAKARVPTSQAGDAAEDPGVESSSATRSASTSSASPPGTCPRMNGPAVSR